MEANIEGLDPEVSPSLPSAPQPETEAESSVRKTERPQKGPTMVVQQNAVPANRYRPERPF